MKYKSVRSFVVSLYMVLGLTGCQKADVGQGDDPDPTSLAQLASTLDVQYEVITNRSDDKCDAEQTDGLCFQARLELTSGVTFDSKTWAIYFSNMAPVQQDSSDEFDILHINGDLHKIIPTSSFNGFNEGQSYSIPFRSGFWHLSQTDRMPNYYLVDETNAPNETYVIDSTRPILDEDTGLEILPYAVPLTLNDAHFKRNPSDKTEPATAAWLYRENAPFYQSQDASNGILPTPRQIELDADGKRLELKTGLHIRSNDFDYKTLDAAFIRLANLGVPLNSEGVPLIISRRNTGQSQSYSLQILRDRVEIQADDAAGAFYALQSLASLLPVKDTSVAMAQIEDAPRFEFRGMHIDVSRNFKSKGFILSVLEQMAWYKLNKFHFHLADDEGWRIEIPSLPELTQVGAYRCHDLTEQTCLLPQLGSGPERSSEVNGYYSFDDYLDILRFAKARHIQVIPSMDMPGHSRAAIKAMSARHNKLVTEGRITAAKQYLLHDVEDSTEYRSVQFYNDNTINACMESSYAFIAKVFDELKLMHDIAGQPLTRYHVGADETAGAWLESSACKTLLKNNVLGIDSAEDIAAHFVERVARILAKRGIEVAGWSDGMGHTNVNRMPYVVQTNAWSPLMWGGHESAHEQANRGWQVVISSPDVLYFDFPYEADADERGYYWAARRANTRKVFNFMPENLPANAEQFRDRQELPYAADDRLRTDDAGKVVYSPLKRDTGFYGIQGQLWTETVRTDRQASYMIFPRLYALAERAWHQAEWEVPYNYAGALYSEETNAFTKSMREQQRQDWVRFANLLVQKALPNAESAGLFYRLPTPGAIIDDGILKMNSLYPGLTLEYRTVDNEWQTYIEPVAVKGAVQVRTQSVDKKRRSRPLHVSKSD